MTALHELTWDELCAAVRVGHVTPELAVQEVMARPILARAALETRIISHVGGTAHKYEALTRAFDLMAQQG